MEIEKSKKEEGHNMIITSPASERDVVIQNDSNYGRTETLYSQPFRS
jgi:hypothetical protein